MYHLYKHHQLPGTGYKGLFASAQAARSSAEERIRSWMNPTQMNDTHWEQHGYNKQMLMFDDGLTRYELYTITPDYT